MKITFVMPGGGLSGGLRVVAVHAERLARRGHEVHVVWSRFPPRTRGERLRALLRGRILRPRRQGSRLFDGLPVTQSIAARPGMPRDADVPEADVVVATWWETAFAVAAFAADKGAKVYFVQGHEVFEHLPSHISRGSYYLPLHKITLTRELVDIMAREYGDTDVDLVPNSVDHRLFNAQPRERNEVPTVGLIYAPMRPKGTDIALEAIARARREVPDLRVVAFGTDTVRQDLPLPEGATYVRLPAQDKIRDIYAMCDLWVMASRSEGFGLPLLEAMACRTPVVSSRAGAAPDLIEDGVNGWVVEVEDPAALARRIVEVARLDPAAWRAMSEAAWHRAHAYTWNDATDLFEAALIRAARPPASRTPASFVPRTA